MDAELMAIVADGDRGRVYLPPDRGHADAADVEAPPDAPHTSLPEQALGFRVQGYGMTRHRDLFTFRQLVALTTFSDLVGEVRERVMKDADAGRRRAP
jgi:putative DNA methylase